ncbi:MAG: ribonuclease HII [Candidatus Omnitrophica bacterium]|nr:ribonuclease HII [Candidatus Omnitrophota bacterium]
MRKKSSAIRLRRCRPTLRHELKAHKAGYRVIAGLDEAGRGPLAGPVVAACLILHDTNFKQKIADSKALTARGRLLAYEEIVEKASFGIGIVSHRAIDKINIYQATIRAMESAVKNLGVKPDFLLVDGVVKLGLKHAQSRIIKGDTKSLTIACASIVAKVTRDRIMCEYHKKYPQYGFSRHKGYGTREHFSCLAKHGPSPIHRYTFNPVKHVSLVIPPLINQSPTKKLTTC